jgi:hypothetical protein
VFEDLMKLRDASNFVTAWHWLAQAVRKPDKHQRFSISGVIYTFDLFPPEEEKSRPNQIYGRLTFAPASDIRPSCWQALFKSCTLVQYKRPPQHNLKKGVGKGLRASFDLLLSLAAIESFCTIEGGVIFVGYQTIIYPTAINHDTGSAQLHLLTCNVGQIDPYQLKYESRLLIEHWSQFKKMQCFLGWCTNTQINLGAECMSTSTIAYTGAPEFERSLQPKGYTALSQVGISSPVSLLWGIEKSFTYDSHVVRFSPIDNYIHLLHDAARGPAMLYDSGSKRCWLVPKLSLLLHMCRAYMNRYLDESAARLLSVPPHADALDLIPNLETLGNAQIHDDAKSPVLLRHLLHILVTNLLQVRQATKPSQKKALYGFEFMDLIVKPDRGSIMKELKLQPAGKTWLELANAVDAIVVCKDVGDVITSTCRPSQCSTLPTGCDYLAASITILEILAERQGNHIIGGDKQVKLGKNAVWDIKSTSFTPCAHKDNDKASCWDKKEVWQQVSSVPGNVDKFVERFSSKKKAGLGAAQIPKTGVVVFGTQDGKGG